MKIPRYLEHQDKKFDLNQFLKPPFEEKKNIKNVAKFRKRGDKKEQNMEAKGKINYNLQSIFSFP